MDLQCLSIIILLFNIQNLKSKFFIFLIRILKKYFQYYTDLKNFDAAEKSLREAIIQNESDIEVASEKLV